MIDTETARNLEITESILKRKTNSLFGFVLAVPPLSRLTPGIRLLNSTFTPQGARLLRTTLLSPITAQLAIDARLSAVADLVNSEGMKFIYAM